MSYVRSDRTIDPDDLVCDFTVEPRGASLAAAAEAIAAESSIGTWTDVAAMSESIRDRLAPAVTRLDETTGQVAIAYPLALFEEGNVPQLLSGVAGNIFGMGALAALRLNDVLLPARYLEGFAGPAVGLAGLRDYFGVRDRPLIGTIVKPKLGLPPDQHAAVAFEAWAGGCDIVKDDENLTNQHFNPFAQRLDATLAAAARAETETGERKLYLPNVTAETEEMLRRSRLVHERGAPAVMVDILTVGWAALQTLRAETRRLGLIIHAHRAFHAAFTRNSRHGMSMLVLAKLARLVGVDLLHIGTGVGKMHGEPAEVRALAETLRSPEGWGAIPPTAPVASGGLQPLHVPALVANLGLDLVIQAGGGIHGHPDGTRAGARAMRQAAEAAAANVPLAEYARRHRELARAMEVWG